MKILHIAVVAATAATLTFTPIAFAAQQPTGPDTAACTAAKAAEQTALGARDAAKVSANIEQQAQVTQKRSTRVAERDRAPRRWRGDRGGQRRGAAANR